MATLKLTAPRFKSANAMQAMLETIAMFVLLDITETDLHAIFAVPMDRANRVPLSVPAAMAIQMTVVLHVPQVITSQLLDVFLAALMVLLA